MKLPVLIAWVLLLAISGAALWSATQRAADARAASAAAREQLITATSLAAELSDLRSRAPITRSAGSGLTQRVSAVLGSCGLPAAALSGVTPEATFRDAAGSRQRGVINLAATLPQVGAFLSAWRTAEPDWIIASIELSPASGNNASPGADLPLRATITVEGATLRPSAPRASLLTGALK